MTESRGISGEISTAPLATTFHIANYLFGFVEQGRIAVSGWQFLHALDEEFCVLRGNTLESASG